MLALSIYRVYLESGQKGAMSPLEHVLQIDLLASQMLMWSCIFFYFTSILYEYMIQQSATEQVVTLDSIKSFFFYRIA